MYAQCKVFLCHFQSMEAEVNRFLREKELSLECVRLTMVPATSLGMVYVVLLYDEEQSHQPEGGKKY